MKAELEQEQYMCAPQGDNHWEWPSVVHANQEGANEDETGRTSPMDSTGAH